MDRRKSWAAYCSPMQAPRDTPFELLLQAHRAQPARAVAQEACRRDIHGKTLSWLQSDYAAIAQGRISRQSQTDSRNHAINGIGGNATRTQYVKKSSGTPQIPVSFARPRHFLPSSRMEHRYYLHSAAKRLCVSGRSNRLVQPVGAFLPPLKQSGGVLLLRCVRRGGRNLRSTKNFQYRPRSSVHVSGIRECRAQQEYPFQHGRARESTRQHLCGAPVEICEIRGCIPA